MKLATIQSTLSPVMNAAAPKRAPEPPQPQLDWKHLLIGIASAAAGAAANVGFHWLNNRFPWLGR